MSFFVGGPGGSAVSFAGFALLSALLLTGLTFSFPGFPTFLPRSFTSIPTSILGVGDPLLLVAPGGGREIFGDARRRALILPLPVDSAFGKIRDETAGDRRRSLPLPSAGGNTVTAKLTVDHLGQPWSPKSLLNFPQDEVPEVQLGAGGAQSGGRGPEGAVELGGGRADHGSSHGPQHVRVHARPVDFVHGHGHLHEVPDLMREIPGPHDEQATGSAEQSQASTAVFLDHRSRFP